MIIIKAKYQEYIKYSTYLILNIEGERREEKDVHVKFYLNSFEETINIAINL